MESEYQIKRGIDLRNRFLDKAISEKLKDVFIEGGPMDKITFLGLSAIFILNIFVALSVFSKDVTPAFSSSAFLMAIANFLEKFGLGNKAGFFSMLSLVSLSFAPIGTYLFVRRVSNRNEFAAALATLFFILPDPVSKHGWPFIYSLLGGDGAHVVAFSFVPFFLLYFKAFISSGNYVWGMISAMGTTLAALISPFTMFNLIIFFGIITVAEGFMGGFRVKFLRLFFVLFSSFGLGYFWFYPLVNKILLLDGVRFALSYIWGIFPLFIPAVPIVGIIFFLIFDGREKLQPLFLAVSFFICYSILINISVSTNTVGIFTANRYTIEFSFVESFFVALIVSYVFFAFKTRFESRLSHNKSKLIKFASGMSPFLIILIIFLMTINNIFLTKEDIASQKVMYQPRSLGVGNIVRVLDVSNFSSILSDMVSIITFILLVYVLKYYLLRPKKV